MIDDGSQIDVLLKRFGAEDPRVFDAIAARYESRIYRLVYSMLRDAAGAEDVTQDTFIKAVSRLHLYRPGTKFKAWIYTIAVNTTRSYLRKQKSRDSLQAVLQALYPLKAKALSPEQARIKAETHASLWDAVDKLNEKQRLPILLRSAHGLTVADISEILGVNKKTLYSRLDTGYRKLKAHLNGQFDL